MWMKIDDGLHAHRKTRAVLKNGNRKRDAAPMGLWVLAGSWAAQNNTDGWVPADELDRFDADAETLAERLVDAGYWWAMKRDGEDGYGFNDWHDYNDPTDAASKAGTFGNHVRWHVNEGKVEPECKHCPTEPDEPEYRGDIGATIGAMSGRVAPDIAPDSPPESRIGSGAIALPEPDPLPDPEPLPPTADGDEPPSRALSVVAAATPALDSPTAQTLVAEWLEHCAERPPGRVVGQVAKELKTLLGEGIDPDRIRRALAEWNRKGLHPSTLPSVVHEVANRAVKARGQQATDDIFDGAMARAIEKDRTA